MRRTLSFTDVVFGWRWMRNPVSRRIVFGALVAAAALLCIFPLRYVANVKLAPQSSNSAGLASVLGQFGGSYAGLLGTIAPGEIDLTIGRSFDVAGDVARRLDMVQGNGPAAIAKAVKMVGSHTTVTGLRGNVIEIEVSSHDRDFSTRVVQAYASVMQARLTRLSREQTDYKLKVLGDRVREASARVARAEAAVTAFRVQNRLLEPGAQFGAAIGTLTSLQAQLQGKQVELQTARQFNSEDSYAVRSIRASIAALRSQIATADARTRNGSGGSAAEIAPKTLEYERRLRELRFSQALYESYSRFIEGAAVEQLSADFNMQVIEGPYLKPGLQPNLWAAAVLTLILLAFLASEFYALRPPPGTRVNAD